MAHRYSEEAVVRIWRNVKTLKVMPTSHFGHAAVTVRGPLAGAGAYISFWPGDGAGMNKTAFKAQAGSTTDGYDEDKTNEMNKMTGVRLEVGWRKQHGIPYPAEWDELLLELGKGPINTPRPGQKRTGIEIDIDGFPLPLWSQSAENKINIPGLGAANIAFGLSTRRMVAWWNTTKANLPNYKALSKINCAGIAIQGLVAGGADAYASPPTIAIYAEPVQVEAYANAVVNKLMRLESDVIDLDASVRNYVMAHTLTPTPTNELVGGQLWPLNTWLNKSKLGGFTIRSGTIRDIDNAVETYHAGDWAGNFNKRLKGLANAVSAVAAHRREKPDSARSEALVRLAAQLVAIVRNPGPIR